MTDASGLLVVDKPGGITSHGVVGRVRRYAGTRKVGHAGTLDPMATGVLVVGINRATRLLGHLALSDKTYAATARLGISTTTDDAEGEVVSQVDASGIVDRVEATLASFVGEIDQVPSSVSAIKVDGRRAYDLVRAGEQVQLKSRRVTLHELTVGEVRVDGSTIDVDFTVRCSTGTYVRAIARDLGAQLGVGGHLVALRRTTVGGVTLAEAHTLEQLEQAVVLLPMAEAARRFFDCLELTPEQANDVRFGRRLDLVLPQGRPTAVLSPQGEFLALYEPGDGVAKAVAVFC